MRNLAIAVFIMGTLFIKDQGENKNITYIFPQDVEIALQKQLSDIDPKYCVYLTIKMIGNNKHNVDTTQVSLVYRTPDIPKGSIDFDIISNSNREALIGTQYVPLVLSEDVFWARKESQQGWGTIENRPYLSFQHYAGVTGRVYTVIFDRKGLIKDFF